MNNKADKQNVKTRAMKKERKRLIKEAWNIYAAMERDLVVYELLDMGVRPDNYLKYWRKY